MFYSYQITANDRVDPAAASLVIRPNNIFLAVDNLKESVAASWGGHNESVLALAPYSSKLLLSGSYDSNLHVWDLETSTRVGVLEGHDDAIRILTSTANCVYSGSYDGTIGA